MTTPPPQADAATQAARNLNDLEPALFYYHTKADVEAIIRAAFAPFLQRAEAAARLRNALQQAVHDAVTLGLEAEQAQEYYDILEETLTPSPASGGGN